MVLNHNLKKNENLDFYGRIEKKTKNGRINGAKARQVYRFLKITVFFHQMVTSGLHQNKYHHGVQRIRISLENDFQRFRTSICQKPVFTNHTVTFEPYGLGRNECHQ